MQTIPQTNPTLVTSSSVMNVTEKTAARILVLGKVRPSDTIPVRINKLHQLAQQSATEAIDHAIAAGELLIETKKSVGHGSWLSWIQENVEFSERTARNYMRVARAFTKLEYEERQRVADLSFRDIMSTLATDTNRLSRLPSTAGAIKLAPHKPKKRKKAKRPNTASRSNGKASYNPSTEETEDEHKHRLELSQACHVLGRAEISKDQLIKRMPPQIRARLQEAITRSHRWLA